MIEDLDNINNSYMVFLKESYQNFLDFSIEIESELNKINIIDDKINLKMSLKYKTIHILLMIKNFCRMHI